jgi:glucan phosphorylase
VPTATAWCVRLRPVPAETIAYFSIEIALGDEIPTLSGGLGGPAGDLLNATARYGCPRGRGQPPLPQGFFRQEFDEAGRQGEHPVRWTPAAHLERLDARIKVIIRNRPGVVGAWRLVSPREHGLDVTHPILCVIDGARAPSSAVKAVCDHPGGPCSFSLVPW